MRKSLIILAALSAIAGSAAAQSSVTIFGIVDVSLTHGSGSVASRTQLSAGNLAGSRLGFRGTEDLGDGLKANFWLEAGLTPDDGKGVSSNTNNQTSGAPATSAAGGQGLTFNRVSYVGLSGNWGELRLGRDYTPTFNGHVYYDPAFLSGVMTSQTAIGSLTIFAPNAPGVAWAGARASNSVSYFTPNISGFSGQIMYALGENSSNAGATVDDGKYIGGRVNYVSGPIDVSLAAAKMNLLAVGDVRETVLAGTYAFGAAKLWGIYLRDDSGTSIDVRAAMLGGTYQIGPTQLKATVSRSKATSATGTPAGTTTKYAIGVAHSLSRRTTLYATAATTRNSDGASALPFFGIAATAANQSARGFDVGIRHTF